jgi:hypothetical protein
MRYLLDSDVVADYLKGRNSARALLEPLFSDGLAISIITYAEVYEPAITSGSRRLDIRDGGSPEGSDCGLAGVYSSAAFASFWNQSPSSPSRASSSASRVSPASQKRKTSAAMSSAHHQWKRAFNAKPTSTVAAM